MKTYTAGAVSESSFLKKKMDPWIRKRWVAKSEVDYQRQNGVGRGKGEKKEDRREHFNKQSFVVLVW